MQRLQIIPPREYGLISLINSYLAFSSFSFFWDGQHFLTSVERPLDTLWSLHNVVFPIVLD